MSPATGRYATVQPTKVYTEANKSSAIETALTVEEHVLCSAMC